MPSEPADKAIPSFTPILEPMKASTESNFMLVSSSYAFFFADQRELLRQQYPQLSLNELNKISLKCWKELSNSQRAKYNDLFTKMKQ